MVEVHTHTFVGGPKDGQREMIQGADAERGSVVIRAEVSPTPVLSRELAPDPAPGKVLMSDTRYERTAYEGEKVRFVFWKAEGLTIDDALRQLFSHYINRFERGT